jgi:hypothetical protein
VDLRDPTAAEELMKHIPAPSADLSSFHRLTNPYNPTPALPNQHFLPQISVLSCLWERPDSAALATLDDQLFSDPKWGWAPLIDPQRTSYQLTEAMDSPLLGLPGFRKAVILGLRNTSLAVAINASKLTMFLTSYDLMLMSSISGAEGDPVLEIRMCDLYALALVNRLGAPNFNPGWPIDQKDAAIAFQYIVSTPQNSYGFFQSFKTVQGMFPDRVLGASSVLFGAGLVLFGAVSCLLMLLCVVGKTSILQDTYVDTLSQRLHNTTLRVGNRQSFRARKFGERWRPPDSCRPKAPSRLSGEVGRSWMLL